MNSSIQKLWGLIRNSKIPKALVFIVFALSIFETVAGLAVPLFTMNLINGFAEGGFTLKAASLVGSVLVVQAIVGFPNS